MLRREKGFKLFLINLTLTSCTVDFVKPSLSTTLQVEMNKVINIADIFKTPILGNCAEKESTIY